MLAGMNLKLPLTDWLNCHAKTIEVYWALFFAIKSQPSRFLWHVAVGMAYGHRIYWTDFLNLSKGGKCKQYNAGHWNQLLYQDQSGG